MIAPVSLTPPPWPRTPAAMQAPTPAPAPLPLYGPEWDAAEAAHRAYVAGMEAEAAAHPEDIADLMRRVK